MGRQSVKGNGTGTKSCGGMRWLIICMFFLMACSMEERAVGYYNFSGDEWPREECAEFQINLLDSSEYNLALALRHNIEFPYKEIWCAVAMRSDSADWYIDTVKVNVTDSLGYWLGSGNNIKSVNTEMTCRGKYFHKGNVRVRIEHLGEGTIHGVRAVGVEFLRGERGEVKGER